MWEFIRQLKRIKYDTLNYIEIKASNLLANYEYLKKQQAGAEIFPVLKSNAYGHGLKEVSSILNSSSAKMVAVDSYPEAQIVYRYFKAKVLILSEMPLPIYKHCYFNKTEFVVYNSTTLKYLSRFGKKIKVHLFMNTGMNREGIKDIPSFIRDNKKYLNQVTVNGFCSHLASADTNSQLNLEQEERFMQGLSALQTAGFSPPWVHLGNSAAIFKTHNKNLTAFRSGLAFYGYSPFKETINDKDLLSRTSILQPALEVYSHVTSIQDIEVGESVSYNETYRSLKKEQIAVIPFGYFEGLDIRLSNKAKFLILGKLKNSWSQIAGRVCMNLTCLHLSQDSSHHLGDLVRVISSCPQDQNSINNLVTLGNLMKYEFLVKFRPNIRRVIN